MKALYLEMDEDGRYVGQLRDTSIALFPSNPLSKWEVTALDSEPMVKVNGFDYSAALMFEWEEPTLMKGLDRLAEQEEVDRIIITDGTETHIHRARLQPVAEAHVPGTVVLPPFLGLPFLGVFAPCTDELHSNSGTVRVKPAEVLKLEYIRVGCSTGTVITLEGGHAVAVGVEPGAVLMRFFHAAPEEAYRLGAEREPQNELASASS